MNINITYEPNPKELANASLLLIEKKPLIFYSIMLVNGFSWLVLLTVILKLYVTHSLLPNESLAGLTAFFWLFGRHRFNKWLLYFRMKRSFLLNAPLTINISLNGIVTSGKKIKTDSLKWEELKFIIETKNGFILPNIGSRFLWLPFRGFASPSDIDDFRQVIIDKQITIRKYLKTSI